MLRYLSSAGDKVEILTVETRTPEKDLPKEIFGYPIDHTLGFACPGYPDMSLTVDLPYFKGSKMMKRLRPDLIHCSSPYVTIVFYKLNGLHVVNYFLFTV